MIGMKHFMQPRNTILRETHLCESPFSSFPNPNSKLKSLRKQRSSKEKASPSDLNSLLPPSPASSKIKSPLPPRPPNLFKRKLATDTLPENEPSRRAGVDVFAEMGDEVTVEDFVPFMGTGEANFLGGEASVKGVKGFDPEAAKKRSFEIYLEKYAKPNSGIGFLGALELINQVCLKVAVASSADRIKVDANLAAAGLPISMFDAIVSAYAFENLTSAPNYINMYFY
ncbi:hypothetical protein Pint_30387 [Pistacia integerrima]|uniref:Uncharacterized protein n=1 Tax=Pistacia integerrima TaxID=434235 RepID=A0ACC0WYX4_9ROSI|nr:hypothetical protein Pint_30387 [Pistacia integerrima]